MRESSTRATNAAAQWRMAGVAVGLLVALHALSPSLANAQDCPAPIESKLTASPSDTGDAVGRSVAIDGDIAVVGSPSNTSTGAAFVYMRESGVWSQQERLQITSNSGAQFGDRVALDGDVAVVAAPRWGSGNIGQVYTFERTENTWTQLGSVVAPVGRNDQRFGGAVDIEGDTLIVGAPFDDATANSSGSAHIYVRSGNSWLLQQSLFPDAGSSLFFGEGVAISGDTVVVTSSGDDDAGQDSGAGYVYTRTDGTWTRQAKLTSAETGLFARLFQADIDGDTIALGSGGSQGEVVVFERSQGVWSSGEIVRATDTQRGDSFGFAVALDGDRLVIGAGDFDKTSTRDGAAYVFVRRNGGWLQHMRLVASDRTEAAVFGSSVAISGATVLVGAPQASIVGDEFVGSAYTFDVPDTSCPPIPPSPRKAQDGFLALRSVVLRPGRDGTNVSLSGTLDLGTRESDLTEFPSLEIAQEQLELPEGATPNRRGRVSWRGEGFSVSVSPSPAGSSKARFRARLSDFANLDDISVLNLQFNANGIGGSASIVPVAGRYRAGRNQRDFPRLAVARLGANVRRPDAHSFSAIFEIARTADGAPPTEAPRLFVQIGEFEQELPTGELTMNERRGTWEFRAARGASGVTFARADYRRGVVTFRARGVSLGEFEKGPQPMVVAVAVGDLLEALNIRVARRGNGLRY